MARQHRGVDIGRRDPLARPGLASAEWWPIQDKVSGTARVLTWDRPGLGPFPRVPLAVLVHDPELMIDRFVKSSRMARADAEQVEGLWGSCFASPRP